MISPKLRNLSLILIILLGLLVLVLVVENANLSKYSTNVDGVNYQIIFEKSSGYRVESNPYDNGDPSFLIYKNDNPITKQGVFISDLVYQEITASLLQTEAAEYVRSKNGVTYYAFEQYEVENEAYSVIIKHKYKPTYIGFEIVCSIDDVIDLLDAITVK